MKIPSQNKYKLVIQMDFSRNILQFQVFIKHSYYYFLILIGGIFLIYVLKRIYLIIKLSLIIFKLLENDLHDKVH